MVFNSVEFLFYFLLFYFLLCRLVNMLSCCYVFCCHVGPLSSSIVVVILFGIRVILLSCLVFLFALVMFGCSIIM